MQTFILSSQMPDDRWLSDTKFEEPKFKQLLIMKNDKTLLETMQDKIYTMINEYPIIVSGIPEIIEKAKRYLIPESNKTSMYTYLSAISTCREGERIIILYGDILYSTAVLKKIYKLNHEFRFFGHHAHCEIYGVSFINNDLMRNAIKEMINRDQNLYDGHLCTYLKEVHEYESKGYMMIKDDNTYEFDYKNQYLKYLKEDNEI